MISRVGSEIKQLSSQGGSIPKAPEKSWTYGLEQFPLQCLFPL